MPRATQTNPFIDTRTYWAENKETFRKIVTNAGGVFNGDQAAYDNSTTIPAGWSPSEGTAAANAWNNVVSALAGVADSQKSARLTERTSNLYTDYTFRTGKLKGFRMGGGVNYRGKQVIGTRGADTVRSPLNPALAVDDAAVGVYNYVYSDPYALATLTFNYTRQFSQKYTLSVDLKVDNVFGYDKPLYYNTVLRPVGGDLSNPGRVATPYNYSWVTPRSYTVSTTLKF